MHAENRHESSKNYFLKTKKKPICSYIFYLKCGVQQVCIINAFSFSATPCSLFIMTVKMSSNKKKKKRNVHLVTHLCCVFKTLTKTNVNKENHTLDLTEIMQYGLLIKQFINLYIKLPSFLCNNCAGFTKPFIKMKGAVQS